MRLWFDECVTPTLEGVAHSRGHEATSNRRRGLLTALVHVVYLRVLAGDWIFVTNNEVDFRRLAADHGLHPGLIILPQGRADQQRDWMREVIDFVETNARSAGETSDDWMVCRIVIYDEHVGDPSWEWIPDPPLG